MTADIPPALIRNMFAAVEDAETRAAIWDRARLRGQEGSALRRGLDVQNYVRLSRAVTLTLDDEFMGLAHRAQRIGVFALIAGVTAHAHSIGEAYERTARSFDLMDNSFSFSFTEQAEEGHFMIKRISDRNVRNELLIETILVSVHRLLAWLGGQLAPITGVWFDYGCPDHARVYDQFFPGARTDFLRENSGFSVPSRTLARPIIRNEAQAVAWARRTPLDALMPVQASSGLALDVSSVIERYLDQRRSLPTLTHVSQLLGVPEYTLRRRLKEEGSDYLEIRSQVRRDLAIKLLNTTDDAVEAIAARIGFSEASAFVRAFKIWTGLPPGTYRRGEE